LNVRASERWSVTGLPSNNARSRITARSFSGDDSPEWARARANRSNDFFPKRDLATVEVKLDPHHAQQKLYLHVLVLLRLIPRFALGGSLFVLDIDHPQLSLIGS
jgi:hypothetical protein